VGLEDESDAFPDFQHVLLFCIVKRVDKYIHLTFLHGSQPRDECQQSCFSGSGRAGKQQNLSGLNDEVDVKENLFSKFALTE
jgi:hypothetical protein